MLHTSSNSLPSYNVRNNEMAHAENSSRVPTSDSRRSSGPEPTYEG